MTFCPSIIMPQVNQYETPYRENDERSHQGVGRVLARIHERHTWPGIKRDVVTQIKHCLICQVTKHPTGNPCYPLQSIKISNFNDLVQFDYLKLCRTESGNTRQLVIVYQITKFAAAVSSAHDEYDARTTAKIILNKWFVRHGTPARRQSGNATNFTAEISQGFIKASLVTKVTSLLTQEEMVSWNNKIEHSSHYFESIHHAGCKIGASTEMESWALTTQLEVQQLGFCPTCSNMELKSQFPYRSYTLSSLREVLSLKMNS